MKNFFVYLILICAVGCKKPTLFSIEMTNTKGDVVTPDRIANDEYLIYYFLSPDCPLSESYTKTIATISEGLDSMKNKFDSYIIIPGDKFSNDEIDSFTSEYHLFLPVLLDSKKVLTDYLGATVTPEVFLINADGKTIYSGAIDNWAVDLGHKRQVITEFYLRDAIAAANERKRIKHRKVHPVGCFIE